MVTESDKAALIGLLARYQETYLTHQRDQMLLKEVTERIAASNEKFKNLRAAFTLFGFAQLSAETWSQLREILGTNAFNAAILEGNAAAAAAAAAAVTAVDVHREEEEDESDEEETDSDEEHGSRPEPEPKTQLLSSQPVQVPTVRDALLIRLRAVGKTGAKATELLSYLQETYGMSLHSKTVGMTLYRLSREEPPKVRRDGRTWLFVPPLAEMKNPGGDTPGSDQLL